MSNEQSEHPYELLAVYVDGTLGADDRGRVDSHLATCDACRDDVEMARRGREALAGLPEVPAPALALGIRRVRRSRRVWQAAGAAAVAAGIVVGAVILGRGVSTQGAGGDAGLSGPARQAPEVAEEEGADPRADDQQVAALAGKEITYEVTQQDYTPGTLATLGRQLRDRAQAVLKQGFPASSRAFFDVFDPQALTPDVRRAVNCVFQEVPPSQDRSVVPFLIQEATFEGEPVYVAAFLQGPSEEAPYDRVLIWVVHRESCALRYYASQRL